MGAGDREGEEEKGESGSLYNPRAASGLLHCCMPRKDGERKRYFLAKPPRFLAL